MSEEMSERIPFDEESILKHTPARPTSGVFILCVGTEPREGWLLVGHDANVRESLLELLADPPEGLDQKPEYFMWVAKPKSQCPAYANKLVQFMKIQDM